jgi:hypothetical protein
MYKIVKIDNRKYYETKSLVNYTFNELKGLKKDYENWCKNKEEETYFGDNVSEFLKGITSDNYTYDNSYNYDNTLDNTIQYCFNKDEIIKTKIIAIQFHLGGDVRGNYSDWHFYYGDIESFFCMINDEELNKKEA